MNPEMLVNLLISSINMSSTKLSPPLFSNNETVIHYHYHYHPNSLNSPNETARPLLSKVNSDPNLPHSLFSSSKADSESTPTQRSWKKHIKREYQSNLDPKDRIFKGTAREEARNLLKKPYFVKVTEPSSSISLIKSSFLSGTTSNKHFTKTQDYQPMLQSSNYFNKKSSKHHPTHFDETIFNPEIKRSQITKESDECLPYPTRGLLTEREQLNETPTYKMALLEEECAFLRSKFLEHYVRDHPERRNR